MAPDLEPNINHSAPVAAELMPAEGCVSYAHMGRLGEARAVVQRLRAIPLNIADDGQRYRNCDYRELYLSGLRSAIVGRHEKLTP